MGASLRIPLSVSIIQITPSHIVLPLEGTESSSISAEHYLKCKSIDLRGVNTVTPYGNDP